VSAQDQTPVRVLVVDDSHVFRHALCAMVTATPGFEVVGAAPSGREAIRWLNALSAHLVMLDVGMPDLDGIETARRIRRRHPDVVIMLLTAARRAHVSDPLLPVEDKRDLTPRWLADYWQRHGQSR
jgi:DNA-binding NarL/FixJ family response regulator